MKTRMKIKKLLALICFVNFVGIIMINMKLSDTVEPYTYDNNERTLSKYLVKYNDNFWRKKDIRKIVVWTTFFGKWDWIDGMKTDLKTCPSSCEVTNDKSEVESADAVLFHVSDMWKYTGLFGLFYNYDTPMPETRTPSQVWVLLSWEPVTKFYGTMRHSSFNWTYTYRRDSMINSLYKTWRKKNTSELKSVTTSSTPKNIFRTKNKFIATAISNCYDRAKRYKIIQELEKYVKIDKFGRCYGKRYPNLNFLGDYKFYISIENTVCRDYITEKFWNALSRNQIPVIATSKYNTQILPPGSYLNIYDFDSVKSFAEELVRITTNETLYNSFFQWQNYYTRGVERYACALCQELHVNHSAQSYVDMEGWIRDDICHKSTIWSLVSEFLSGLLFQIGLG